MSTPMLMCLALNRPHHHRRSGKRPPQPRPQVDHPDRLVRNPDASRSCRAAWCWLGNGGLGQHGQIVPLGPVDNAGRRPVALPGGPPPSRLGRNTSGPGRSGGTALPERGNPRTGTSGQSRASALRHKPKRVLDAKQNGCNTARLTRRLGIEVWGATTGQLATVWPSSRSFCFGAPIIRVRPHHRIHQGEHGQRRAPPPLLNCPWLPACQTPAFYAAPCGRQRAKEKTDPNPCITTARAMPQDPSLPSAANIRGSWQPLTAGRWFRARGTPIDCPDPG